MRLPIEKVDASVFDSGSWNDLEDVLISKNPFGFRPIQQRVYFDSPYEFRRLVSGLYAMTHEVDHNQAARFPGVLVDLDGVHYHIHGIGHATTLRRIVEESFSHLDYDEVLACEAKMDTRHDLDAHIQSKDNDLRFVPKRLRDPWLSRLSRMVKTLIPPIRRPAYEKTMDDVLGDRGSAIVSDKLIDGIHLPEHLVQSFPLYALRKENTYLGRVDVRNMLRSLSMTYFIQDVAKYTKASHMHFLCGFDHEADIVGFLNNKDIANRIVNYSHS